MRGVMCALALLAACGQSEPGGRTAEATAAPTELAGHVVVIGHAGWRLDIDPAAGMLLAIEDGAQTISAAHAAPQRTSNGFRFVSGDLRVTLENTACVQDGADFPMTAEVRARGRTLLGCATERWDAHLIERVPQIDACIALAPEARRVTWAGPRARGYVVRLWGESGGVDCAVGLAGYAQVAPRDDNVRIGGEREAIFVRAPGPNPGGECFEAPEVRSAEGELLGWMDDPLGC